MPKPNLLGTRSPDMLELHGNVGILRLLAAACDFLYVGKHKIASKMRISTKCNYFIV